MPANVGGASERRSTSQCAISLRDQFLRGQHLAGFSHLIGHVDAQALEAGLACLRAGVVDSNVAIKGHVQVSPHRPTM